MIYDFHTDIISFKHNSKTNDNKNFNTVKKRKYLKNLLKKDIRCVLAIYLDRPTTISTVARIINNYKTITHVFGIENAGLIQGTTKELATLNAQFYGLTHNASNKFASGCYANGGLTERGKQLIKDLLKYGKTLDLAHINKRSFFDIIDHIDSLNNKNILKSCNKNTKNIVCSHSCFNEINPHCRNFSYEQVKAIVDRDGLIGLTLVKNFLGGDSVDIVIRHIEWFCNNFNATQLCIGTDFYGTTPLNCLPNYESIYKLTNKLIKLGYSKQDIDNIFYYNLFNYTSTLIEGNT